MLSLPEFHMSSLRNMRSVAVAYASVKLAPARTTVCRIDGVTVRRLAGLDAESQRQTMAMMVDAECPFRKAYGAFYSGMGCSRGMTLAQASHAIHTRGVRRESEGF